ncbi:MAG TPA: ROK family protein [Polyangia bacterium]|nr:ROK family protein [Polyangia bacterium]
MSAKAPQMNNILVVDVGGTHIKVLASGHAARRQIPSSPTLTAVQMVKAVKALTADWGYARVSIGFPGPVRHGKITAEPTHLGGGWRRCDFEAAFGCPVKLINDAALQAFGSYRTGSMLFLGLGTGLGSALIVDHVIAPLELAHLPYKKGGTYEDYVGVRGLERCGKRKWRRHVFDVVARLKAALQAEDLVLGGGNVKLLDRLPEGARRGDNLNAFKGGYRLWTHPPLATG